jgi:hypothetical protein
LKTPHKSTIPLAWLKSEISASLIGKRRYPIFLIKLCHL